MHIRVGEEKKMRLRELYTGNKYYSYVAFSNKDAAETEILLDELDGGGYRYWLNAKLSPNEKDLREILDRLKKAAVAILVYTSNAIEDRLFRAVAEYALDSRIPIAVYVPGEENASRAYLNSLLERSIKSVVYRAAEENYRFSNTLKALLDCTKGIPVSEAARLFEEGKSTLQNESSTDDMKEQAIKNINYSASSDYAPALSYLGDLSLQGARKGLNPYHNAVSYYQKAMKYGDINAVYNLGCMISDGEGFKQNYTLASKYISVSAMALPDNADAQFRFAEMLENGLGVPVKHDDAYVYYRRALEKGDRRAYLPLAYRYLIGDSVPRNETMAAEYFTEAAKDGSTEAKLKLAELYRDGVGVAKNPDKAEIYFREAADDDIAEAQYQYALILKNKKKYTEAFNWMKLAAKPREYGKEPKAEILYELAEFYTTGNGVEQDRAEAFMYYHRAAELGHSAASRAVAECYRHGKGVAVNKRAAEFYAE